jgi:hypothetical protein
VQKGFAKWFPLTAFVSPSRSARACTTQPRGRKVPPLPFRQPVSCASSVALKFHHASAALRTNQVNNRRDDAGTTFNGKCLEFWHGLTPRTLRDQCLFGISSSNHSYPYAIESEFRMQVRCSSEMSMQKRCHWERWAISKEFR